MLCGLASGARMPPNVAGLHLLTVKLFLLENCYGKTLILCLGSLFMERTYTMINELF